jgi:putative Holliday junction resolvase
MSRYTPDIFLTAAARGTCLMALDVSARRIGMAVTNPERTLALPAGTLARGKWAADAAALIEIIRERKIGGLVIGLPLRADGTTGPAAQSRLTFARNLNLKLAEQGIDIPHVFIDETLTTEAARDTLSGRGEAHQAEDQIAAQQLLASLIK